jgi:RNA polymerase sigma factor (sigma-70 family)
MNGMNGKREHDSPWQAVEAVMARAQQGDDEAREELFAVLRRKLMAVAVPRVSMDADDVVQETLIIVHQRLADFESLKALTAFTNTTLRHKIGHVYRDRKFEGDLRVDFKDIAEPQYEIDDEVDAAQADQIIRACIDKIAEKQCDCRVILLGLYEGLSMEEISQQAGISKEKLKVRTFRCRQALHKLLTGEYSFQV